MALKAIQFEEYWQRCISCGSWFGVDAFFDNERRKSKASFYCPNGHSQVYTENEADRLRRELEAERQRVALERGMRITAENRLAVVQKEAKRVSRRIHAGVCPCCNRTFQNLARHMATKHPEKTPLR
jgi:ABC-type sulfate transport system substrate-binding protein